MRDCVRVRVLAKRRLTRNLAAKLCASRKGTTLRNLPVRQDSARKRSYSSPPWNFQPTCSRNLRLRKEIAPVACGNERCYYRRRLARTSYVSRERNDVINELVILPNNNCCDERLRGVTVTIIAETKRPGKFPDVRIMHSRARCAGSWVNLRADNGILSTAW